MLCIQNYEDIIKYEISYDEFARDIIAIHNQDCKLINSFYAIDILNNRKINEEFMRNIVYINTNYVNYTKLNENSMIDFNRTIIVDKHKRPIGVINMGIILDEYDLYIDTNNKQMFVIEPSNYKYVICVNASNIMAILISSACLNIFSIEYKSSQVMTMLRCINDTIVFNDNR